MHHQAGGSAAAANHQSNQVVEESRQLRRVEVIMYCTSGLISGCGLLTWVKTDRTTSCSTQVTRAAFYRDEFMLGSLASR